MTGAHRLRRLAFIAAAAFLVLGADEAEPRATLASDKLLESYSGRADVAGSELVGLLLGEEPSDLPGPAEVRLATPEPGKPALLCVRVTTRDGLFWSDNPFEISEPIAASSIIAGPVAALHRSALASYPPSQIMVRAAVPSGDCTDLSDLRRYTPAIGDPGNELRVYLNTRGRAAAARLRTLAAEPAIVDAADCNAFARGSTVAADRTCVLTLPEVLPAGDYDLHVRIRGRLEFEDRHYTVRLPARPR